VSAPLITAAGFYPDITCDQYFAEPCPAPALTNSGVQLLIPTGAAPAKFAYHHPAIGEPPEETRDTIASYRGKLVHRLALGKGRDYVISPHDRYQSDEAKAWKAATEKAGLMPVKKASFDEAEKMAAIVRERIEAACEGCEYQTEVVIAWQEQTSLGPVWCRSMIDVWCADLMLALDVKTCDDASDDSLQRKFANGYAIQDAWYRRGIEALTKEHGRTRFGFLFVESEPPHLARVATATEGFRTAATFECNRALAIFADCLSRNQWPGYDQATVPPPSWLINRWDASSFLEIAA
jgi:hypothetical protein